jgi:hypothetical protein
MKPLSLIAIKNLVLIVFVYMALTACHRDTDLTAPSKVNTPILPPADSLAVLEGTYVGTQYYYGFSPNGTHKDSIVNVTGVLKYSSKDSTMQFAALKQNGDTIMIYRDRAILEYSSPVKFTFGLESQYCEHNYMEFDRALNTAAIYFDDVCGPGGEDYSFYGKKQ